MQGSIASVDALIGKNKHNPTMQSFWNFQRANNTQFDLQAYNDFIYYYIYTCIIIICRGIVYIILTLASHN